MKKQLKLVHLKLDSFVTQFTDNAEKTINGGSFNCKYTSLKCGDPGPTYDTTDNTPASHSGSCTC